MSVERFAQGRDRYLTELAQALRDGSYRPQPVRRVYIGDGIKIPKSGRKMPAVKHLHQESAGNTNPEYIMGHSIQVISLLVAAAASFFAGPLAGRIHEGGEVHQPRSANPARKVCHSARLARHR
jgi:hypothetical protein